LALTELRRENVGLRQQCAEVKELREHNAQLRKTVAMDNENQQRGQRWRWIDDKGADLLERIQRRTVDLQSNAQGLEKAMADASHYCVEVARWAQGDAPNRRGVYATQASTIRGVAPRPELLSSEVAIWDQRARTLRLCVTELSHAAAATQQGAQEIASALNAAIRVETQAKAEAQGAPMHRTMGQEGVGSRRGHVAEASPSHVTRAESPKPLYNGRMADGSPRRQYQLLQSMSPQSAAGVLHVMRTRARS